MSKRLNQLFSRLHYDKVGGLFYLKDKKSWLNKFPFRTGRIIADVIKPYAFINLFHTDESNGENLNINSPFILFFDNPSDDDWKRIQKHLFSFGLALLAVVNRESQGTLDIYHGYSLDNEFAASRKLKQLFLGEDCLKIDNFYNKKLWDEYIEPNFENTKSIDEYLLKNIVDARRILVASDGEQLNPQIANRLIGRLLFTRYLIDRNVKLSEQNYIPNDKSSTKYDKRNALNKLIPDKKNLYKFFKYLADHFEGELFPVTVDEEKQVTSAHLQVVYHLFNCSEFFRGDKYNGYKVQPSLFDTYDFEVIPVEFISNVYQHFIGQDVRENDISLTKQESLKAYYTPPFLVDYVLSQTVEKILSSKNVAQCRTLDPACGSGIFLVETLRKIIEKNMIISGTPQTDSDDLWEIVIDNIYGFDIDNSAIEITIFSIYITLLDYKTPKEIDSFKFKKLKNTNLFGGVEADFFNQKHPYWLIQKRKPFDCIVGNPPWGTVKNSPYLKYISARNELEKQQEDYIKLEIGNNEISQAFMIRVSDFANIKTKIGLIVTGKNFYNTQGTIKQWRNYFLQKFKIEQFIDLSSLNHKAAGGRALFAGAKQSTVIVFYKYDPKCNLNNILKHITFKYNRFYEILGSLVIERNNVKSIKQKFFSEVHGGHDWLWRLFIHGNIHDFHFIKRLKQDYLPLKLYMKENGLKYHGGYKRNDKSVKGYTDTQKYKAWKHINAKTDFTASHSLTTPATWETACNELKPKDFNKYVCKEFPNSSENKYACAQFPDEKFLTGNKLLFKKGIQAETYYPIISLNNDNILFSSTVCSIISETKENEKLLKYLSGLILEDIFSYYLMSVSSSTGIDRSRFQFDEFFDFPVPVFYNQQVVDLINELYLLKQQKNEATFYSDDIDLSIESCVTNLQELVYALYGITDKEKALIDYVQKISIPLFKRKIDSDYFLPIDSNSKRFLDDYINVFLEHFSQRLKGKHFGVEVSITSLFVGMIFKIYDTPPKQNVSFVNQGFVNQLGFLGIYEIAPKLMAQQDIRGFCPNSFYIIKPNEKKYWHKALAYLDIDDFIKAIIKSEKKFRGKIK